MAGFDVGAIGAGVSDIFQGFAAGTKAKGDILEAQAYDKAAQLALQNEQFTKQSTAIQEAQANRELLLSTGRTQAEVAGAGFARVGSFNPCTSPGQLGDVRCDPPCLIAREQISPSPHFFGLFIRG
jgi:hypothetical protein